MTTTPWAEREGVHPQALIEWLDEVHNIRLERRGSKLVTLSTGEINSEVMSVVRSNGHELLYWLAAADWGWMWNERVTRGICFTH